MKINLKKLHKDTRGIAHLLLIILIAAGVGAIGFAYWRVSSYNNQSKATGKDTVAPDGSSSNSGTISDECVAKTGDENICRLGAISDPSQYSSVVTVDMDGLKSVIKYDGKGNSDTTVGDIGRGITINGKNYIYMMDAWYDGGDDDSQMPKSQMPSLGFATTAGIKYENLGKVPCGKDTCFKYRMSGGILGDGVVVCWFGDQDFLPRRYESTGGLLGKLTITIQYKDVTITAPKGAKPISSLIPSAQ